MYVYIMISIGNNQICRYLSISKYVHIHMSVLMYMCCNSTAHSRNKLIDFRYTLQLKLTGIV